jgi:hypothetical protein
VGKQMPITSTKDAFDFAVALGVVLLEVLTWMRERADTVDIVSVYPLPVERFRVRHSLRLRDCDEIVLNSHRDINVGEENEDLGPRILLQRFPLKMASMSRPPSDPPRG